MLEWLHRISNSQGYSTSAFAAVILGLVVLLVVTYALTLARLFKICLLSDSRGISLNNIQCISGFKWNLARWCQLSILISCTTTREETCHSSLIHVTLMNRLNLTVTKRKTTFPSHSHSRGEAARATRVTDVCVLGDSKLALKGFLGRLQKIWK